MVNVAGARKRLNGLLSPGGLLGSTRVCRASVRRDRAPHSRARHKRCWLSKRIRLQSCKRRRRNVQKGKFASRGKGHRENAPPKGTSPTRSHRSRIRCVKRRAISALPLTSKIYSKIVSRSNVAEGRNSTRRRFIGGCLFLRLRSGKERVERRVNFPKGHVRARIVKRTTNAGANHGKAVRVLRPLASPNPDGIAEGFARGSIFAVLDARTKRGRHIG